MSIRRRLLDRIENVARERERAERALRAAATAGDRDRIRERMRMLDTIERAAREDLGAPAWSSTDGRTA